MNNNTLNIMRYSIVAMIWVGVLVLGIFAIVNGSSVNGSSNDAAIPIGIAAFVTAAIATGFILDNDKKANATEQSTNAKRKNDHSGGLDPLSLLTPDDLEDLRQEVKERLRERIVSGEDGELSSLDALLADSRKRK